jgi:Protein of unknown function (DUF1573)
MKKTHFFIYIASFLYLSVGTVISDVFAQTAQTAQLQASKIEFTEADHDFGDIKQGDVVQHTFVFKNTGTIPLILTNVQTTCGCTAPTWTRDPIMPGKTGQIEVKFNSEGKEGMQNKIITVFSNASNPQARIRITTNVLLLFYVTLTML